MCPTRHFKVKLNRLQWRLNVAYLLHFVAEYVIKISTLRVPIKATGEHIIKWLKETINNGAVDYKKGNQCSALKYFKTA